jgi:hypothetical protein
MDSLRDALKGALAPSEGLVARDPSPQDDAKRAPEPLDPTGSAWLTELARHTKIPKDTKTSTLRQLTDRLVKELATAGKGRDSRALADARDNYLRAAERAAWDHIKRRFEELELSDKAYRALKQAKNVHPEKVLAALYTKRAETYRGASAERVRDWLLSL